MLANTAVEKLPLPITTGCPVTMLVATARNGIARLLKSSVARHGASSSWTVANNFCPPNTPVGSTALPFDTPSRALRKISLTSRLRRKLKSLRCRLSLKTFCQSIVRVIVFISSASLPIAYMLPTTAPMLVPAMTSIGMWRRSSSSMTPIWAKPLAPPPPSTRPIRGRLLAVKAGGTACTAGASCSAARAPTGTNTASTSMDSQRPECRERVKLCPSCSAPLHYDFRWRHAPGLGNRKVFTMAASGRGQPIVLVAITQFGLQQLAGRRMRQVSDDQHIIGHPPFGNLALQIGKNAFFRDCCTLFLT